jgi:hypothetical protein
MLLNPKGSIIWPELDRHLVSDFHARAGQGNDRVDKFIFSWIVLNHYYTLWAATNPSPAWGGNRPSERQEARHLATLPALQSKWNEFTSLHDVNSKFIELPLLDRHNQPVPRNVTGKTYVHALSSADYLEVLYQLRCDFFHGKRSLRGYDNQSKLWFCADSSYELTKYLIKETAP